MSKYIKLEDALKEAKAWSMFGKDDLVSRLEKLPSIDIVLCKDCKYFVPRTDHTGLCGWHKSMGHNVGVAVNDYCSFGGREEQEDG